MPDLQINYLAVGAAALSTIVIGALWYSPLLFGKAWEKAHGFSAEQLERVRRQAGCAFFVSSLAYVVMATVLSALMSYVGISTIGQGACLGFLVWLGFLATLGLTAHMFSKNDGLSISSMLVINSSTRLSWA